RVSSATTTSTAASVASARFVRSARFPIGVPTTWSVPGAASAFGIESAADFDGVPELRFQELAELSGEARLELTHALARHAELIPELLQRERIFRDEPLLEDLEVLARERLLELLELLPHDFRELGALRGGLRTVRHGRQEIHARRLSAFAVPDRRI